MASPFITGFFSFCKKSRKGITYLVAFVTTVYLSILLYPLLYKPTTKTADKKIIAAADSLNYAIIKDDAFDDDNSNDYNGKYKPQYNNHKKITPFYFDPNTLSVAGWQQLGVSDKTIAGIQKYLSKGGKFKTPEAINKIWGISDADKAILLPYVRIAAQSTSNKFFDNSNNYSPNPYPKKIISAVEINSTDSTSLEALPGIGPGFAKRIINFRNKLGGFYKVEQVAETFGLPDSTFQKVKPYIKIDANTIKKININTASLDELKAHPYIRWQLANVIMAYKKEHGNFTSIEALKKIMIIDDITYNKISPYLTL
ncbi:helix-hairpin-helix domain-containing protein [Ferruginibacter yonginensis]|uniref:Helix-hairpin-helix domain-containing protein n=1 Tax=Ferruginibacter yonginensis TaxID=1310416 RepID=A0ABV8QRX7_9BACT